MKRVLVILILAYVALFGTVSFLKYNSFEYYDFDLAIHVQSVWNIIHGSTATSILGISFLGNHLNLILFLIAPIYSVLRSPLTLLFLQTLFLASGAWFIYLIARELINEKFALLFGFLYLIYPALGYVNLYEFHPVSFSTFFLLGMFYYFLKDNFRVFVIFMVLALLSKENVSLVMITFGLYAALRRRSLKWSLLPLFIGALWFIISIGIIIPYFNKGIIDFFIRYRYLGENYFEVIKNVVLHPVFALKIMATPMKLKYLVQLFAPLSFLSLLNPLSLLISLPIFLQHLLSRRMTEHTIYYLYGALMTPFIFISAIYAVKSLLRIRVIAKRAILLLVALLIVGLGCNWWLGPHFRLPFDMKKFVRDELDLQKQEFLSLVPQEAGVVATFEFLPRLAQRKSLYSFHQLYTGRYAFLDKKYILPDDAQYALIDFTYRLTFSSFVTPQGSNNIRRFLEDGKWGVVRAVENIVMFKRNYAKGERLYEILPERQEGIKVLGTTSDGTIGIVGIEGKLKQVRAGEIVPLVFLWQKLKSTGKDYWVFFQLVDAEGEVIHQGAGPLGYRIYPSYEWKIGEMVKEKRWWLFPKKISAGKYRLEIGLFDGKTGEGKVLLTGEMNVEES